MTIFINHEGVFDKPQNYYDFMFILMPNLKYEKDDKKTIDYIDYIKCIKNLCVKNLYDENKQKKMNDDYNKNAIKCCDNVLKYIDEQINAINQ